MTGQREFRRSFDSLPAIVAFTAEVFARERIDPRLRPAVELALEELFTNTVKYGKCSRADVRVRIAAIDGGVEVTLTDRDVDAFDVTKAPDADVRLPIDQRQPGGLGLHLVRELLDSLEYEYSPADRQSRITFRKTVTEQSARGPAADGGPSGARE